MNIQGMFLVESVTMQCTGEETYHIKGKDFSLWLTKEHIKNFGLSDVSEFRNKILLCNFMALEMQIISFGDSINLLSIGANDLRVKKVVSKSVTTFDEYHRFLSKPKTSVQYTLKLRSYDGDSGSLEIYDPPRFKFNVDISATEYAAIKQLPTNTFFQLQSIEMEDNLQYRLS